MIYQSERGDIRLLLTGDTMLSRRLTPFNEPDYLALVELVRGADCAFANFETTVRERHEGAPQFQLGTPMTTPPALLDDMRWMGFDIYSGANNHATDYGVEGVLAMQAHFRRRNLPLAGIGANLAEARAPAYVDVAAGRVALIAANAFFVPGTQAGEQRADSPGRPGINPIHFTTTYTVDQESLQTLRRLGDKLGLAQEKARYRAHFFAASEAPKDEDSKLNFLGGNFRLGDGFGVSTTASPADTAGILRAIREARRQADWVIFSFHFHEFGAGGRLTAQNLTDLEEPAEFVVELSRAAIDAGADVVAGHGPHLTLGLELYKGRPIFYSLGNFALQNDTIEVVPAESYGRFGLGHEATPADFLDIRSGNGTRGFPASREYWESVVATCDFSAGKLAAVTLHPIDLAFGRPRAQRGRPLLAHGEVAARALQRVRDLSRRYGADIRIDGERATVRL